MALIGIRPLGLIIGLNACSGAALPAENPHHSTNFTRSQGLWDAESSFKVCETAEQWQRICAQSEEESDCKIHRLFAEECRYTHLPPVTYRHSPDFWQRTQDHRLALDLHNEPFILREFVVPRMKNLAKLQLFRSQYRERTLRAAHSEADLENRGWLISQAIEEYRELDGACELIVGKWDFTREQMLLPVLGAVPQYRRHLPAGEAEDLLEHYRFPASIQTINDAALELYVQIRLLESERQRIRKQIRTLVDDYNAAVETYNDEIRRRGSFQLLPTIEF